MVNIVVLAGAQDDVRKNLRDVEDYIDLLQIMHAQVNGWVTTDIIVQGEDIAKLFEEAVEATQ